MTSEFIDGVRSSAHHGIRGIDLTFEYGVARTGVFCGPASTEDCGSAVPGWGAGATHEGEFAYTHGGNLVALGMQSEPLRSIRWAPRGASTRDRSISVTRPLNQHRYRSEAAREGIFL